MIDRNAFFTPSLQLNLSQPLATAKCFPFLPENCYTEDWLEYQVIESCYNTRMETEPNPEEGASAPDNSKEEGSLDTSGFETTAERLEELIKSMEMMLLDVEQLRTTCSEQASELMHAAADLRKQQEDLKESYCELSREIQEIVESMDNLFSTKSAFEPQEKQTQKLNQQLWGTKSDWQILLLFVECLGLGFWVCMLTFWMDGLVMGWDAEVWCCWIVVSSLCEDFCHWLPSLATTVTNILIFFLIFII